MMTTANTKNGMKMLDLEDMEKVNGGFLRYLFQACYEYWKQEAEKKAALEAEQERRTHITEQEPFNHYPRESDQIVYCGIM